AQDTAVQSWVCELLQRNATKGEEVVPEAVIKALGASTFAGTFLRYLHCWMYGSDYLSCNGDGRFLYMSISLPFSRFVQMLAYMMTFVMAMIHFPEAQKRAQAEIDEVIGNKRLPTFDDRMSLPYCEGLFRELFRWHGPAPLGEPLCISMCT
ncbi:hypothetical protein C0989_012048, partial [Termitomyces sp. Mn162]